MLSQINNIDVVKPPPKTIALYSATTVTVIYVVPTGKAFKGKIIGATSSGFKLNGGSEITLGANTIDIDLVAAEFITVVGNYGITIIGVETWV